MPCTTYPPPNPKGGLTLASEGKLIFNMEKIDTISPLLLTPMLSKVSSISINLMKRAPPQAKEDRRQPLSAISSSNHKKSQDQGPTLLKEQETLHTGL